MIKLLKFIPKINAIKLALNFYYLNQLNKLYMLKLDYKKLYRDVQEKDSSISKGQLQKNLGVKVHNIHLWQKKLASQSLIKMFLKIEEITGNKATDYIINEKEQNG